MDLVKKYDIQAPRYTSYPPVPFWNKKINQGLWINGLKSQGRLEDGIDLYLHIPYCKSLCWYCGCHRIVTKDQNVEKSYIDYLLREWELYQQQLGDIKVNSLHLGGGTPTFLSADGLEKVFNKLLANRADDFIGAIEIDPRTVEDAQLNILKRFGFKRISMGIQDFDPKVQAAINRVQPVEMVTQLCSKLREMGFESINFDLIYGLPHQTRASIENTINIVNELGPDMIAFYSYAHVPWKVKNQKLIKEEHLPMGEAKKELAEIGEQLLCEKSYIKIGFDHFAKETSYLARQKNDGKLLRSFMGYTDKKAHTQLALGVSGIGNSDVGFVQNTKEVKDYFELIDAGNLPIVNGHLNNQRDVVTAKLIQDIMCNSKATIPSEIHSPDRLEMLYEMESDGLLQITEDRLRVTEVGVDFLRNIATVFDEYFKTGSHGFSRTV